jgi:hypothetical protein
MHYISDTFFLVRTEQIHDVLVPLVKIFGRVAEPGQSVTSIGPCEGPNLEELWKRFSNLERTELESTNLLYEQPNNKITPLLRLLKKPNTNPETETENTQHVAISNLYYSLADTSPKVTINQNMVFLNEDILACIVIPKKNMAWV